MAKRINLGASWGIPPKKAGKRWAAIAETTKSDSDLVVILNWPNTTPRKLLERIERERMIASPDIKSMLRKYIDLGHGDTILKTRDPET